MSSFWRCSAPSFLVFGWMSADWIIIESFDNNVLSSFGDNGSVEKSEVIIFSRVPSLKNKSPSFFSFLFAYSANASVFQPSSEGLSIAFHFDFESVFELMEVFSELDEKLVGDFPELSTGWVSFFSQFVANKSKMIVSIWVTHFANKTVLCFFVINLKLVSEVGTSTWEELLTSEKEQYTQYVAQHYKKFLQKNISDKKNIFLQQPRLHDIVFNIFWMILYTCIETIHI